MLEVSRKFLRDESRDFFFCFYTKIIYSTVGVIDLPHAASLLLALNLIILRLRNYIQVAQTS